MKASEIPNNEAERLAAVYRYNILDTEEEADFNDIVELASQLLDTPIALVTLLDEKRQWFKAKKGLTINETDRKLSFCAHAIHHGDVMVVEDALNDERFNDNPLVIGEPYIRFYAGMPLITNDGYRLGTLGVIDRKPKQINEQQYSSLRILANQVVTLLNLRYNIAGRKEAENQLRRINKNLNYRVREKTVQITEILDRISDAFIALDTKGRVLYANQKAGLIVNRSPEEVIGKYIWDMFPEAASLSFQRSADTAMTSQQYQSQQIYYPSYDHWFEHCIYPSPTGLSIYLRDITEEKKAEIAINKSEETRKLIMESSLDAILCINSKGEITFWNPQSTQIFGWSKKEVIGKPLVDTIIPERYRKQHLAGFQRYLNTQKSNLMNRVIETTAINKQQQEFPIELTIVPMKQDTEELFCAFIRDIKERKLAEVKFIAEKELSDSIINSLPGVFYLFDKNGNFLRWNKNLEIISGYSTQEVSSMNPFDFFDKDEQVLIKKNINKVFSGGEVEVEANFITKDGQKIPFYFNGKLTTVENEPCLIGMGIDISRRKKAEERYRTIFENALEGIYQATKEGTFITANPAMARIFGYDTPNDLITSVTDIGTEMYIKPSDRLHMTDLLERYGQVGGMEVKMRKKNKETIWVRTNNLAVKDEQGNVQYIEGILEDITERKTSEERLKSQFVELQKTNHELDHFVYSVSHDLRAPLASLLGLIYLAQKEKDIHSHQQYWELAHHSITRLDNFIKDILNYSRNSRMELELTKIDFAKLIEEVKHNFSHLNDFARVQIDTEIKDDVPFYTDRTRIEIILNNLISNSIKYQDFDKEHPRISLSIVCSEKNACIKAWDNGIGISNEYLSSIFNMFYRASEASKGAGLGLYIAKEAVTKLGGTIQVQSQHGAFTLFEVTLPNLMVCKAKRTKSDG
ncbi:hypothetical protein GCM10009122_57120 [Fulvivirga kasyanovii]|uniref:histidine kinase n=1 Tax=Fulvivirga kasyanovii TaxID=396812 RepID=A0ABW9RJL9_9BACT|nr:PAS domain S-box protein [Fulvivirga kasyanovii]MTI24156.1 PAS domain S-box protein [Fulvivirga kasyanovii]